MSDAVFAPLFAAESILPLWLGLALIPVLILINGYFVAAEFAIVAIRVTRVEELVNAGVPRAKQLLEAVQNLDRSVAVAQLGITVASLALGFVSEPALAKLIEPLLSPLPEAYVGALKHVFSVGLTLGLITYLHVVFGEQMPKIAALQSPERISLLVALPLNIMARLSMPLIRLMNGSSSFFLRQIGYHATDSHGEIYTVNELRLLVEDSQEAGLIDKEAAEYVMSVFALSDVKVKDIMVPWKQVEALELHAKEEQVLAAVREGAHTRMPVYETNPDRIVGIVNTKDLFFLFSLNRAVHLADAIYDPQFLDENDSVLHALRMFKKSKRHLAIVRNEAKKSVGIITLENVLEEIVGDIEDEHDNAEEWTKRIKNTLARHNLPLPLKRSNTLKVGKAIQPVPPKKNPGG